MTMTLQSLCQQYLQHLYQGRSGDTDPLFQDQQTIAETYGEILYPSIDKLLSHITLTQEDTLLDLGSGLGKFAIYVFLRTTIKAAYGIEILPRLHQQALIAADKCRQELPQFMQNGRELKFFLGNFLEMSYAGASVVLVSSPCFSPHLLRQLAKIIDETESIHTVFTFRPLDVKRLAFKTAIRIACSWDTTLCYLYTPKV